MRWTVSDYAVAAVMVAVTLGVALTDRPIASSLRSWPESNSTLPACNYFPSGLNGQPCADANEHERTGRIVLYWHFPDKPAGDN